VSYLAYIPGYEIVGWSHKWDRLRSVHFTSILFDLLALLGLSLVGRRFGGPRLAATAAFAWVAWPFTQYASNSNTNDSIAPALLIWGFLVLTSDFGRGAFAALSGWTKFASLLVLPLWSGYPEARRPRSIALSLAGFLVASAVVFSILLEPSPLHAARVFYDRTVRFQVGRASPFSVWDWGQYHAKGLPDLHLVQRVLQVVLVIGALALAWFPRLRSPLRMAALTAAVLIGFELVLTHWFYLYLPWFFPFVALALVRRSRSAVGEPRSRPELIAAVCSLFLFCWGLVHLDLWSKGAIVDWPTCRRYGDAILHQGLVPYRASRSSTRRALVAFIAPAAFGDYASAFAWQMAACGVLLVIAVALIRIEASFYVALAPVLVGSLILSRFDLWPALLTVAALAALLRQRHVLGWGFLGAAVAAKLWPFVLVPLALVWSYRAGRIRAAFAGLAVVGRTSSRSSRRAVCGTASAARVSTAADRKPGRVVLHRLQPPARDRRTARRTHAGHGAVGAAFALLEVTTLLALDRLRAVGDRCTAPALCRRGRCAFVAFGKVLSPSS
jgi:hypothetical protein